MQPKISACIFLSLVGAVTCIGLLGPSASSALESGFSETPSSTLPQAACAPAVGKARCLAIIGPTATLPPVISAGTLSPGASPATEGTSAHCIVNVEYEYCGSGANRGFSPQDLQSAYRLPSGSAGFGQTVAIVDAYDDPNAQADINIYRSTYNLPPCEAGCFSKVNQKGEAKNYPAASAEWTLEISLDIDMVSAACPKCHILLVEAKSSSLEDLGIAENEAVSLGATEVSNSFGAREIEMGKAEVEILGSYFNHPGTPILAGAGDDGYINENFEHQNEKGECINCSPMFPAALGSVYAVGGTELTPSGESGRGWSENAWHLTGSGCTLYVPKPKWQTDKGCANRTDDDISAQGASAVSVYDTYGQKVPGWQVVSGTSVSTPLDAAAIALEASTMRAEGLEGIYAHPTNWYDIVEGDNWIGLQPICSSEYLCVAKVGYDGPTGIGSPNGQAPATPPSAFTEATTDVTTTEAKVNGVVNAEAVSGATYYFQYGTKPSYGGEAPVGGAKITGYTKAMTVSQTLAGLAPGTLYHYRVVAKSSGGTTFGVDRTFSTPPKVFLANFGGKGSTEGKLEGPRWTATDLNGNVWVSDYTNNRIEEFSASGTFLQACGSAGTGSGQFNGPTGITVNPTSNGYTGGDIYVSDSGNGRIEVFTPTCKYVESIGAPGSGNGQLSNPTGLAFGQGGQRFYKQPFVLWVADTGNNRIETFNWAINDAQWKPGEFVATYGIKGSGAGQFVSPTGVTFGGAEHSGREKLFVVDSGNNRIQVIEEEEWTSGHEKVSFAYSGQFGAAGSGNGQFSSPTAAALDPTTGDLAVTDTGNNRVEEFLPNGTFLAKFGTKGAGSESFEGPKGISVSSIGTLEIADSGNNRVDSWQSAPAIPEWTITATPNPEKALNSYLSDVSCSASSACTAVGDYNLKLGAYMPLAERWNGNEWSLQTPPSPSESKTSELTGVSCASATSCEAVGNYQKASGVYYLVAEGWNGTEWKVQTTTEPIGTLNAVFDSISCTSASECTASGYVENSSGVVAGLGERWNGTEWKIQATPTPPGAKQTEPLGVSCSSATACTLVGEYVNSSGVSVPLAESWNGTEWSLQTAKTPSGATRSGLESVSCTSATACTAAGIYANAASAELAFAERWNGSEWAVQTVPLPAGAKYTYGWGVSCSTASSCSIVGVARTTAEKFVTLAEHWNGMEWAVQPTPNNAEGVGWLSGGISCPAEKLCAAVGNAGKTLAEMYR